MEKIIAYTKGEARGNPGPAGIGVSLVTPLKEVVREVGQSIGNASSNFAEYQAVVVALHTLKKIYGPKTKTMHFELKLDNAPIKRQINHEDQIKEPGLMPLFMEIHNLKVASFPQLTITLITPDENSDAHRLVAALLPLK